MEEGREPGPSQNVSLGLFGLQSPEHSPILSLSHLMNSFCFNFNTRKLDTTPFLFFEIGSV